MVQRLHWLVWPPRSNPCCQPAILLEAVAQKGIEGVPAKIRGCQIGPCCWSTEMWHRVSPRNCAAPARERDAHPLRAALPCSASPSLLRARPSLSNSPIPRFAIRLQASLSVSLFSSSLPPSRLTSHQRACRRIFRPARVARLISQSSPSFRSIPQRPPNNALPVSAPFAASLRFFCLWSFDSTRPDFLRLLGFLVDSQFGPLLNTTIVSCLSLQPINYPRSIQIDLVDFWIDSYHLPRESFRSSDRLRTWKKELQLTRAQYQATDTSLFSFTPLIKLDGQHNSFKSLTDKAQRLTSQAPHRPFPK